MAQKNDGDDEEEFPPRELFDEYVERLVEDADDPELGTIESLLQKMGFSIVVPEEEKRRVPATRTKGFKFFVVNIYLKDVDDEVVATHRQMTVVIPDPPSFDPLLDNEYDRAFLKEAYISWT